MNWSQSEDTQGKFKNVLFVVYFRHFANHLQLNSDLLNISTANAFNRITNIHENSIQSENKIVCTPHGITHQNQ